MERALASSRDRQPAPPVKKRRIRLMIVDDSVVARSVLSRMVGSDDAFEIAAVAGTAEDAIDALQAVRVDTILLDLEMPGAGGLRSIPRILDNACGAHIMIVSSMAEEGAEETVVRSGAWGGRCLAEAGDGAVQRTLLRSPGLAPQGAWLCGRQTACRRQAGQPGRSRAASGHVGRAGRAACDRRIDGRHPRAQQLLRDASEAHRRSDPRHPALARAIHARLRPPARHCGEARGACRRRGHVAASRPNHHRSRRCSSDGRRRVRTGRSCTSTAAPLIQAACRRSTRCSSRPARSSERRQLAWS